MTLRPPFSRVSMTPPMAPLATASGLMIPNVLSMAICCCSSSDFLLTCWRALLQKRGDRLAEVGGGGGDGDAGGAHGGHLVLRSALAAADDGAGVSHAAARGGRHPGDEAGDRLLHVRLHEGGGVFFRVAA